MAARTRKVLNYQLPITNYQFPGLFTYPVAPMDFASSFRVKPRSRLSLKSVNPRDTTGVKGKTEAELRLGAAALRLAELQERMFALRTWAVLLVFQAMDAAGKDGTIKHVLSAVNPRGCRVVSFGVPSDEELNHDYLWRASRALPERGIIAAHNRSHYEEVIVTRVHPRVLERQRMPDTTRGPDLIARRYRAINRFEQHLVDNGTIVLKFFLHISKREQWRRLRDRMEDPDKYWKLQAGDFRERLHWEKYMSAYEDVFRHTSTRHAPWFIVPADHKWFARCAVAEIVTARLGELQLEYPKPTGARRAEWEKAREELRNSLTSEGEPK
jgi:PPK2 family polyphosphate:nucleotide phosphotransferase